jgi:hypothetical protein
VNWKSVFHAGALGFGSAGQGIPAFQGMVNEHFLNGCVFA